MNIFLNSVMIISCYFLIKNMVTRRHYDYISDAIHKYHAEVIRDFDYLTGYPKFQVEYEDMEAYKTTLFRFWDWSYKHILPKDKLAIIEPYIKH